MESKHGWTVFEFRGTSVSLLSCEVVANFARRYLDGYVRTSQTEPSTAWAHVFAVTEEVPRLHDVRDRCRRGLHMPAASSGVARHWLDPNSRRVWSDIVDPGEGALSVTRVVRLMLHAGLQELGHLAIHAAAFEHPGGGTVAVVGDKFAGKTTTVVNAALSGLSLMANDTVYVGPGTGPVDVCALPVSIGVRNGTLALFRPIRDFAAGKQRGPDNRFYLHPRELAHLGGASAYPAGDLRGIIFPVFQPELRELRATSLTKAALLARLADAVLEAEPFQYAPEWKVLTARWLPEQVSQLLQRVVAQVPGFTVQQSSHTNGAFVRSLTELLA